jgi:succinate dehydrogenase / fumarate reductase cytochrome b subunit
MSKFLTTSIGQKLVMSISGLFLILFLLVHLTINAFLLAPEGLFGFEVGQMFNAGAHFMGTFPVIKVMEPVLGIGFLVHIVYSLILTVQNRKARGTDRYASGNKTKGIEWTSKNMLPLGIAILAFLVVHIADFYMKIKFGVGGHPGEAEFPYLGTGMMVGEDAYTLVNAAFGNPLLVVAYVIGSIALAFHLSHGFWSAFQTIGWNNQIWMQRLKCIGNIVAWVIGGGFSIIAIGQYFFFQ